MVTRAVQLSAFPDLAPDRPFGPIVGSVFVGTNAELIAAIAPLYLTGNVCDLTYGRGGWWTRYRPDTLVAHDLNGDGVDFTRLPEIDDTYDAVTFDPPYVAPGGRITSTSPDYRDRFGLNQRSPNTLWRLITAGMVEAARVTKPGGWVICKCNDSTTGSALDLGHMRMLTVADCIGLRLHDLIVHNTGSGPGGHNIVTVQRARRHHSYLLAFKVRP